MRNAFMRRNATVFSLVIASGVVATVSYVGGGPASTAWAKEGRPSAGPDIARGRFFDTADNARKLDRRRGPFFGLRVHSMDVGGDAKNVACFEYVIDGLRPGPQPETYDLVRTVYAVRVAPSSCDEVMGLPFPPSAEIKGWRGRMVQTRWMRRDGPSGTPIGGFVGRLAIEAIVSDAGRGIGVFDFHLAGTTGLRPMRGDPDDASARTDEDRCSAPRHDEGWYVGKIQRRALMAYARELGDVDGVPTMLRTLDRAILAGTFEGRLKLEADDTGRLDFCDIAAGAWWFDGLLAWDARAARVRNHTEGADTTDSASSTRE